MTPVQCSQVHSYGERAAASQHQVTHLAMEGHWNIGYWNIAILDIGTLE